MNKMQKLTESFKMKYEAFITGCDSIEEMGLWNKEEHGEMEAFYFNDLISIILRIIVTDNIIAQKEVEFLNEMFDFSYTVEELGMVYKSCGDNLVSNSFDENFENGISLMRKCNTKLADAYKELLCLVCEIIVESDGVVSEGEIAEINKYKALCG